MSASPEAQETIGNYLIERPLAHGSMGHVYVARHTLTYARVALKVLRDDLAADTQAEERFLREVRAAAQIGHDGIVKVHDAGRHHDGRLYLAMELLSGETLEDRMVAERGQRLVLMDWIARALEPLSAAHAQGIIHRDLKPANVFIAHAADGGERIKLLDFGLARDVSQKSGTETGIALGTPYYMSPEQATRPKQVGPASDVWSMGVMMYEVLSGHMPFDGETLHAVVIHSTTKPHLALSVREPRLDADLCQLVEDCLCKEPEQRPRDAGELLLRLRPLLEDDHVRNALREPVIIVPPEHAAVSRDRIPYADTAISFSPPRLLDSHMPHVPKRNQGRPWLLGIAGVLLVVFGVVWLLLRQSTQPANAASASPTAPKVAQPAPQLAPPATPALEAAQVKPEPNGTGKRGVPGKTEAMSPGSGKLDPNARPTHPQPSAAEPAATGDHGDHADQPDHSNTAQANNPGAQAKGAPPNAPQPGETKPTGNAAQPTDEAAPATRFDVPQPPAAKPPDDNPAVDHEAPTPPNEPLPPPDPPEPGASEP